MSFEEARTRASAAKRKAQRVSAAVSVLSEVLKSAAAYSDHTTQLLDAEEEVAEAHAALAALLERCDGGDDLKRQRSAWYEAAGGKRQS